MPSLSAQIMNGLFRLMRVKKAFSHYADREALRAELVKKPRASGDPRPALYKVVDLSCRTVQGAKVYTLRPKSKPVARHIMYLHGGGFIVDMSPMHWSYMRKLVTTLDAEVTVPLYPLLPEYDCKHVMDFVVPVYEQLLKEAGANRLTIMGDSAGGTLVAALALVARDKGLSQPAGLVMICPCLDWTISDPDQLAIDLIDPLLSITTMRAVGGWYADAWPVTDPRVSPLFGSLEGLAPIQIFAGSKDLLVTDARRLKAKAEAQNVPVEYHEGEGLAHGWPLFFFPESRKAQDQICDFVLARTPTIVTAAA